MTDVMADALVVERMKEETVKGGDANKVLDAAVHRIHHGIPWGWLADDIRVVGQPSHFHDNWRHSYNFFDACALIPQGF